MFLDKFAVQYRKKHPKDCYEASRFLILIYLFLVKFLPFLIKAQNALLVTKNALLLYKI